MHGLWTIKTFISYIQPNPMPYTLCISSASPPGGLLSPAGSPTDVTARRNEGVFLKAHTHVLAMYTVDTHARGREHIHSPLPLLLGYGALRADSVFFLFPLWWPQVLCHSTELPISWVPNKGGWQTSYCESISAWEIIYIRYLQSKNQSCRQKENWDL